MNIGLKRRFYFIYTQILLQYKKINDQIQSIEHQLKDFPDGNLVCTHNGKYYKWYQSTGHSCTYIPKKDKAFANKLALKKYLISQLKDLQQEKIAIEHYLKRHSNSSYVQKILNHPEFQTLLTPYFTPISKKLSEWMNEPFEQNQKHPEHLIHKSSSGHLLRSKSEAIIDMLLYMHKVPFRYECALHLGESTIFPDFTIKHPNTGDTYYWEHFGLMDNPQYSQNTFSKLQIYSSNGIIPSINLITTFENKEHPLDVETISKIIEHYFE